VIFVDGWGRISRFQRFQKRVRMLMGCWNND
jgi:hypothetical protein